MRLLVTGGAGFIGSHVADAGVARGWEVACLDDLSTGRRENVPEGAKLFEVDVRCLDDVRAAFREFRPNAVSHQAAQASVSVSVREPGLDAEINVVGSLHVIEAALEQQTERFVFASTGGAIYGEIPEPTRAAVGDPMHPLSPYACSKRAVEMYLEAYGEGGPLESVTLRYANVYGPRQDPHGEAGVVAIFAERLLAGDPVKVFARREPGDGGCVRDYVHVEDVSRANLLALEGRIGRPVVNVCTGVGTTTAELLERMQALTGSASPVEQAGPRAGDLERSVLDPGDFAKTLGEATRLDEGLRSTIDWFRARASAT